MSRPPKAAAQTPLIPILRQVGHVLAFDAAWGGMGWALCHSQGPMQTGWVKLRSKAWPMASLRDYLAGLDHVIADAQMALPAGCPPLRIVIEEPPAIYSGAARGKTGQPVGNQALTGFGLGRIVGAIECWACRSDLGYPWLVSPGEWRLWWKIGGKGRAEKKHAALALTRAQGWQPFTVEFPFDPEEGGARADVAEAILLGVGAASRLHEAPVGPRITPPTVLASGAAPAHPVRPPSRA